MKGVVGDYLNTRYILKGWVVELYIELTCSFIFNSSICVVLRINILLIIRCK